MGVIERFNLSEFKKVKEEDEIPGNFTSVRGAYYIPNINKIGFHKENGCMIGAENDADLRELLASKVLDVIGMPHADIVPIYDDKSRQNGCLSINILKDNEIFIESQSKSHQVNAAKTVKDFIENDIKRISELPGITPEVIENRRKYIAQYLFVSALISNTDIKMDNMQIIYNQETGKYRNAEYYDAGVSFILDQDRYFFDEKNPEKILSELYKDYAVDIFPLAQQTEQRLTKDKITELMLDSIYDGFDEKIKKNISIGLNNRVNLITKYNHNILKYGTAEPPIISVKSINEATKETDISIKDKVISFINELKYKIIGKDNRNGNDR